MKNERRRFLRIKYPDDRRPGLLIKMRGGQVKKCEVLDISEKGISFVGGEFSLLRPNSRIEAKITFIDGASLDIAGTVLRVIGNHAVMYLPKSIPFSRINQEQRLLGD